MLDFITEVDSFVYSQVSYLKSSFFEELFGYITLLGGSYVAIFVLLLFLSWLFRRRQILILYTFLFVFLLAEASSYLLKIAINRPRPETAMLKEFTPSFPSGHTLTATVLYGGIAVVLSWLVKRGLISKKRAAVLVSLLSATVFLVGISRLYLGVHYFTDVAGGFLVGSLFVGILYFLCSKR